MIDWNVALATATRLTNPGPQVSAAEATDAVAELREAAERSAGPVRDYTGLTADPGLSPVHVVDRPRWVEANITVFEQLMQPVVDKLTGNKPINPAAAAVGGKITGAEVGVVMSYLSSKVLGQFDPFGTEAGRLLLVAPNIVAAERKLGVDPHDFRMWVCLHEETHRVQFTANPWLAGHLRTLLSEFTDSTNMSIDRLTESVGEIVKIVRGQSTASLADIVQTAEQKAVVEKVTGVMSLLEGHADVVMDGVGPEVIPSVASIRRKFEQRRDSGSSLDKIVKRLLGLEAKLAQYRDGAAFVRGVVDVVGMDGFNAVWTGPQTLPSKAEIADPAAWVTRVHA